MGRTWCARSASGPSPRCCNGKPLGSLDSLGNCNNTEIFSLCLRRPIVAFNPRARGATEADAAKLHHLRVVAETVGCGVEECMLVDDMPGAQPLLRSWVLRRSLSRARAENVDGATDAGSFGVLVREPRAGFRLEDMEHWLRGSASV